MQKLQLENQDLRQQVLRLTTQRDQSARASKKSSPEAISEDEDGKPDDPLAAYAQPARVLGLMQNPWITRAMLQQRIPTMKPDDPARYDNDRTRADGEIADVYATFPETLHAGIEQQGEIRSRVSTTCPPLKDTYTGSRSSRSSAASARRSWET